MIDHSEDWRKVPYNPFDLLTSLAKSCGLTCYELIAGVDYEDGDRIRLERDDSLFMLFETPKEAHIYLLGYKDGLRREQSNKPHDR